MLIWAGQISGLDNVLSNISGGIFTDLSLESILGYLFAPIAWVIGVPSEDVLYIGQLLGKKMTINEVFAYVDLMNMNAEDSGIKLTEKSKLMATYALCGFANFASIGIQIGGISAIAPKKRKELTELGLKAMIGGTIAALLTAAIAGALLG